MIGHLRRLLHPLLLRLWIRHARDRELSTRINGITLKVFPSVFHPRFFGSSAIFANYLRALPVRGKRVLDLGTGSGIVGICTAQAGATVTAADINPRAVECAAINAKCAQVQMECRFSDVFSGLREGRFDIVAWNPPFFPKAPGDLTEAALCAGPNYEVIQRFASQLRNHLAPGGQVFLILSMDLPLDRWNEVFADANFRLERRHEQRWWGETMVIVEVVEARSRPSDKDRRL